MDRIRLSLAVSLAAISLVILDHEFTCRHILFCTAPLARWADGVNVVQDGGFEAEGLQPNTEGFMSIPVGSPALPNWEVQGVQGEQDVASVLDTSVFHVTTPEGHQFLDLTGGKDVSKNGFFAAVQQTVPTKRGEPYQVTLLIGWYNPTFPGPVEAIVNLFDATSDQLLSAVTCAPSNSTTMGSQWAPCGTGFVAQGDATTNRIVGLEIKGPGQTKYIGLDAVNVQCVAPLGDHSRCI